MTEMPPLAEQAGWPDDDPDTVFDTDIDIAAEEEEAAVAEREADWDFASCCGGRDPSCGHYGYGIFTMADYRAKYEVVEP